MTLCSGAGQELDVEVWVRVLRTRFREGLRGALLFRVLYRLFWDEFEKLLGPHPKAR